MTLVSIALMMFAEIAECVIVGATEIKSTSEPPLRESEFELIEKPSASTSPDTGE